MLKVIWFPGVMVVAGLVGYLGTVAIGTPANTSYIDTEVAPAGASVTIDGKSLGTGTSSVSAGQHVVKASKSGFGTQSKTIQTQAGETAYAGFVLNSNSDSTKSWYQDHSSDLQLSQNISSHISDNAQKIATQSSPIFDELPQSLPDGHGGTIDIAPGTPLPNTDQPSVHVQASTPNDRQAALEWMRSNGYDPADIDIVFDNGNNPFSEEGDE